MTGVMCLTIGKNHSISMANFINGIYFVKAGGRVWKVIKN